MGESAWRVDQGRVGIKQARRMSASGKVALPEDTIEILSLFLGEGLQQSGEQRQL